MLNAIFQSETEMLYPVSTSGKKKKKKYRATKTYSVTRSYGKLFFHVLKTNDFTITYHKYKLKKDVVLQIREEGERPLLYAFFKTPARFSIDEGEEIKAGPFEFGLMHAPASVCSITLEKKQKYLFCTVQFPVYFVKEFLPLFHSLIPFYIKTATGRPHHLRHYPLKKEMLKELKKIRECPFNAELRSIYVQTILRAFFINAFANISSAEFTPPSEIRNSKKIQEAATIMEQHLDLPHTIAELAKLVHTNSTDLKQGFREVYGTTVLGYLTHKRMEKAVRLILLSPLTINAISAEIGYANDKAFIKAFRKKFDCTPDVLRKM